MSFSAHPLPAKSRGGFALISVLALVSLAALTATAFLASARLERQATLPLGNALRLEWALTAGEMAAQQTINDATEPAEGTVKNFVTTLWRGTNTADWTNEIGYLLIGEPNSTNNVRWTYYAGFSPAGLANLTTNTIRTNMIFTNSHQGTYFSESSAFFTNATKGFTNNPAPTNPICTTIPLLGGQTSPPVGWVYLTQRMRQKNSTNASDVTSPVARVAWFIEDLSGKINAEQMGSLSGNRSTGTNPEEISLTSMTRTNGTRIFSGSTNLMTNATNRKLFFTPGLLAESSISGLTNSDDLRYFATGLREFRPINNNGNNGMLDWIPSGIPIAIQGNSTNSYANGGSSKLSLNQLINLTAPSNVASIAAVISNNLPDFASIRAGGFTNSSGGGATNTNAYTRGAYYLTLAANMVNYATNTSTPVTDGTVLSTNKDRPLYRGVGNFPFVNEYVTRFNLLSTNSTNVSGTAGMAIIIQTTDYVELWNPCNQTNSGALSFMPINRQPFTAGFANFNFTNPLWASNGSRVNGGVYTNITNITIPPNGFLVLGFSTITNCFFYPGTNLALPLSLSDNLNSSYKVAWNNVYYDGALGGLRRQAKVLSAINSPKWSGTCPSFVGEDLTTFWNMSGDPRATIYQSKPQSSISYDSRSSFGGRNYRNGLTANPYGEVKPSLWPDRGHNSAQGNLPPSGVNTLPTATPAAAYSNCPPCRISSGSGYSNVVELGNIFDPIQWFDSGGIGATTGYGSDGGQWINLTPTAVASNAYGGGTSLRVGRAELGKFAFTNFAGNSTPAIPNMGGSSAALLDLFCVSNGNTGGGPFRTGGKINLNTAPAPVLRALAGGIYLRSDPALLAGGTNFSVPPAMAEAFAQGVMRFRSQYPFLTPSHLTFIGTDPAWPNTNSWPNNSVFGNINTISLVTNSANSLTTTSLGVTEWNDQAAEEWFSKIYNLSTVQSDNYRAYIVAQLVDSNSAPISPVVRKYVQFFARPNNPPPGDITSNNVYGVPMYYWPLSKGLKKAYESPY
jgi:hypothetical protein